MSAAVSVFAVWFGIVIVLGAIAIAVAPRLHRPRWLARAGDRLAAAEDGASAAIGRFGTGIAVWLAGWAVVIAVGWPLGMLAHRLQNAVDWPVFRWLQRHHLNATGDWSRVWHRLTNIGASWLTEYIAIGAAVLFLGLYAGKRLMWLPSVTMLLGYVATFAAQLLIKDVVHRGHPPTTLGTWPSGGVGRVICIYGLIVFFVILRFWPARPRVWAAGAALVLLLASIQAYARLYNLEHWLTDVIGGFVFGTLMLVTMVLGYRAIARDRVEPQAVDQGRSAPSRAASAAL